MIANILYFKYFRLTEIFLSFEITVIKIKIILFFINEIFVCTDLKITRNFFQALHKKKKVRCYEQIFGLINGVVLMHGTSLGWD